MARILTGSKAQVSINGQIVGFMSGVNVDYEYTLQRADILGQLHTGDLAETGFTARCSCDHFLATDAAVLSTATELGFEQMVLENMRNQAYFDIEIFDNTNKNEIRIKLLQCKFAGGSGRMAARDMWTGSWNFEALQVDHPTARAAV